MALEKLYLSTHGIVKDHSSIILDEDISEEPSSLESVELFGNELFIRIDIVNRSYEIQVNFILSEKVELDANFFYKIQDEVSSFISKRQRSERNCFFNTSQEYLLSSIISSRQLTHFNCYFYSFESSFSSCFLKTGEREEIDLAFHTFFFSEITGINSFRELSKCSSFINCIIREGITLKNNFRYKEQINLGIKSTSLAYNRNGNIFKNTTFLSGCNSYFKTKVIEEINVSSFLRMSYEITSSYKATTLEFPLNCQMAIYMVSIVSCFINSIDFGSFNSFISKRQNNYLNIFLTKQSRNILSCDLGKHFNRLSAFRFINSSHSLNASFSRMNERLSAFLHSFYNAEINCSLPNQKIHQDCFIKVVIGYSLTVAIAHVGNVAVCSVNGKYWASLSANRARETNRLSSGFFDVLYVAKQTVSFPPYRNPLSCNFQNVFEVHQLTAISSSRGYGKINCHFDAFNIREKVTSILSFRERSKLSLELKNVKAAYSITVNLAFKLGMAPCFVHCIETSEITVAFGAFRNYASCSIYCISKYEVTAKLPLFRYSANCHVEKVIETSIINSLISSRGFGQINCRVNAFNIIEGISSTISFKQIEKLSCAFVDAKPSYELTLSFPYKFGRANVYLYCISAYRLDVSLARETNRLSSFIHCIEAHSLSSGLVGQKFNIIGKIKTSSKNEINVGYSVKPSGYLSASCRVNFKDEISIVTSFRETSSLTCFYSALETSEKEVSYKVNVKEEVSSSIPSTTIGSEITSNLIIKERVELDAYYNIMIRESLETFIRSLYITSLSCFFKCNEPYPVSYSFECSISCQRQFDSTYPEEQVVELEFSSFSIKENSL
jgi:hypothetical protein